MALNCGLFDSTTVVETESGYPRGDKAKDAAFFARYFASFVGNGVYRNSENSFLVMAYSGLTVQVRPGSAFINGYFCYDDDTAYHTFSVDSVLHEYWAVIRLNTNTGAIALSWFTDPTAGSLPKRDDGIYDLVIAKILVPPNRTEITDAMITDCRADTGLCGFVTDLLDRIGTVVDYATLAGGIEGTLPISQGGTGSTTALNARASLGLGTSAVLNAGVASGTATLNAYGKVSPSQASRYVTGVSASKTLSTADAGTFQVINGSDDVVITLPAGSDIPLGTEIEFCLTSTGGNSLIITNGLGGAKLNGVPVTRNAVVTDRYSVISVKLLDEDDWLVSGNYELSA